MTTILIITLNALAYQDFTQSQKLVDSVPTASDLLATSIAISADGTTIAVGSHNDDDDFSNSGAVFIFEKSGGTWSEQDKLKASDVSASDFFGKDVALSDDGDTLLVGADGEDTGGSGAGQAYVFTRSGSVWTEEDKFQGSDLDGNDGFGRSVALSADGDTALVGANLEDTDQTNSGAMYVFTRSGSVWTEEDKLKPGSLPNSGEFGRSVALSADGNTAVGGNLGFNSSVGAAHVFTRSGSVWSFEQTVEPDDKGSLSGTLVGFSVSLSTDGDTLFMGSNDPTDAGIAYTFTRSATVWSQQQKFTGFESVDRFGVRGFLSGDATKLLIGAQNEDGGGSDEGRAYTYSFSGGTWTFEQTLVSDDIADSDQFGTDAVMSRDGNTVGIGAVGDNSFAGAAYIFET